MNAGVLVAVLTYNEGEKLKRLVGRFPRPADYQVVFVDDGSTDDTLRFLQDTGLKVIHHGENLGVGAGIRSAVEYGRTNGFDVIVIMAANGKMLPEEIPRLLEPILDGRADYVQGSRNLKGGQSPNLPLFRKVAIRLFTMIVNAVLGFRGTDVTCGFRAYRLSLLEDPDIDISQDWLGRYEMEYYLHYKAIKKGYRVVEVPVSMVYPRGDRDYSKIKPFAGWWSMVRPWIFLVLGLKK
ncbi:MAG: glycosyltransferase family 2 protein [candidate division Zixibacteria bacterium]|nr:glycosyltransferase family 2 protein [candidate division Zixibacteria bacterium]